MIEKNDSVVISLDEHKQVREALKRLNPNDVCVGAVVYWGSDMVVGRWFMVDGIYKDQGRPFVDLRDVNTNLLYCHVPVESLGKNWNQQLLDVLRKDCREKANRTVLPETHFIRNLGGGSRPLIKFNTEAYKLENMLESVLKEKGLVPESCLFMQTDISKLNNLRVYGVENSVFDEKNINDKNFRGENDDPEVHVFLSSYEELKNSSEHVTLSEFGDFEISPITPVVGVYHRCALEMVGEDGGYMFYEPKDGYTMKQALAGVVVFRFAETVRGK